MILMVDCHVKICRDVSRERNSQVGLELTGPSIRLTHGCVASIESRIIVLDSDGTRMFVSVKRLINTSGVYLMFVGCCRD
jgi:hypothetical protein